jgi:hypothetical protein
MSFTGKKLQHATSGKSLKTFFQNEDGAFDLASIMVGVVVTGIIGGIVAATIFAVIPWSQNNAAKSQLDTVDTAENTYRGLAIGNGGDVYAPYDGSANIVSSPSNVLLSKGIQGLTVKTGTNSSGAACYVASMVSASGAKFYSTNASKASVTPPTTAQCNV